MLIFVRYAELGAWVRGCYDNPKAHKKFTAPTPSGATLLLPADVGLFDRVVIRENQTKGQRIRA